MSIKIVPLQSCHLNELIEILQDLSNFYPDFSKLDSIYEEFISQKNLYSIVALADKEVVGFGSIFFFQRVRGGKEAIVEDLIVSRNYRKLGIGTKILKNLISEAKVQKCFKICLESKIKSEIFYSKQGFLKGGSTMKYFI